MKRAFLVLVICVCAFGKISAQTQYQNSGWLFFLNSTKLSEKWGLHLDVQVRTADDMRFVRNTLVRPGLTYYINANSNATLGYLLATTYSGGIKIGGDSSPLNEHRIWEQYIYAHKLKSIFASHRFRLEQRFVETRTDDFFSQRFRYFFRLIQPLKKDEPKFTKGAFVALQNEIFLNIQNKDKINNSVFDQNRAYLAIGYRFSKKLDLEAGYLNQAIHGANFNTINNVLQLAIYTRF